jgi:hypothetical protein
MPYQITRNRARCKQCDDIIESKHKHDFKWCRCASIYIDGGLDYLRRGGIVERIEEMSEVESGYPHASDYHLTDEDIDIE